MIKLDLSDAPHLLPFGPNDSLPIELANKPVSELNLCERKLRFVAAIKAEDIEDIKAILNQKYDTGYFIPDESYKPSEQMSALCMAIEKGNLEMVQLMIDHGCSVNHHIAGYSPLHYAIYAGHLEILKLLIKQGADLNAVSCHGNTPIQLAARLKSSEVVQVLIDAGSDIEETNAQGQTPLIIACSYNHFEIAELLIKHGARVNVADKCDKTPLYYAVDQYMGINLKLVKLLLDVGANPDQINDRGEIALTTAIRRASETNLEGQYAVRALIEHNCRLDINEVGFLKQNALHVAISRKQDRIVEMLVRAGCDVNIKGIEDLTPLERLVINGNYDMANLLLKAGAKPKMSERAIEKMKTNPSEQHLPLQYLIMYWTDKRLSLQHICRLSLRRHFGRRSDDIITNHLFIPAKIERFLLLMDC